MNKVSLTIKLDNIARHGFFSFSGFNFTVELDVTFSNHELGFATAAHQVFQFKNNIKFYGLVVYVYIVHCSTFTGKCKPGYAHCVWHYRVHHLHY